jgi:hypothetical protein
MEPMVTRQECGHISLFHLIDADGTFCLAFRAQHLLVHRFTLQIPKGFFCSWGCRIGLRISLHEPSDDSVQSFLRVYRITMHSISWREEVQQIL